jgi:hypothetical protein
VFRKYSGTSHYLPNDNGLGIPIRPAHYVLWRANFGNTFGAAGTGFAAAVETPEPGSLLLAIVAVFAASSFTSRRPTRRSLE